MLMAHRLGRTPGVSLVGSTGVQLVGRRRGLGAVTPVSAYKAKAEALAAEAVAPFQVVGVHIGAKTGRMYQFYDEDEANGSYGDLADDPGLFIYIALFKNGELYEEAYFAGKETETVVTTTTTVKKKSYVPWLIGGGVALAVIGGAVYLARR